MAWAVLPLCLFLISMGIRLPSLSDTRTPKPRPRAVIENSFQSTKVAAVKAAVAIEVVDNVPVLASPATHNSRFVTGTCQFSSIAPPLSDARAPPRRTC